MPSTNDPQKTIASSVTISGTGLHTGEFVTLTLKPAPINYGYKFVRSDIEGLSLIHISEPTRPY